MNKLRIFIKSKKAKALILCVILICGIICADLIVNMHTTEKTFVAMGTVVRTELKGKDSGSAESEICEMITGIEASCLSRREKSSDVYRINSNPGKFTTVSKDTARWIGDCIEISERSSGAFDITAGAVTNLWDFESEKNIIPSDENIKKGVSFIGYSDIVYNDFSVKTGDNQYIDLGAVGKGIACDEARKILENRKIKSGIVSVGGSVLVYGKTATVGVVNPFDDSKTAGTLKFKNKCISTSGDYERFFEKDGVRYHHIIDPKTGYPVKNNLKSVTVLCDSGLLSDALSTACFVLGYKGSLGLLNKYDDVQAVFIFKDKTVAVTDGLKNNFKLTDSDYKIK